MSSAPTAFLPANPRWLTRFGWTVAIYNVAVILFGAWVRVTGSGAGCGEHWPSCRGEVIPRAPSTQTIIEYTHRLTSGFEGVLVIALLVLVFRYAPLGRTARTWARAALGFLVVEALLGAALVKFGLVAGDTRPARAVVVALHLVNTLMLTATLALVPLSLQYHTPISAPREVPRGLVTAAGVLFALVCATGAVTALGDTLFPMGDGTVAERLALDQSGTAHILQRLRIVHPALAVLTAAILIPWSASLSSAEVSPPMRTATQWLLATVLVQTALGALNIMLSAPAWMQIVHLAAAFAVWLSLVTFWHLATPHRNS